MLQIRDEHCKWGHKGCGGMNVEISMHGYNGKRFEAEYELPYSSHECAEPGVILRTDDPTDDRSWNVFMIDGHPRIERLR